ncbi:MAG: hypothetical protein WAW61_05635 [Methylococcaceae bacterium]
MALDTRFPAGMTSYLNICENDEASSARECFRESGRAALQRQRCHDRWILKTDIIDFYDWNSRGFIVARQTYNNCLETTWA